jgi:hypothetical protein
MFLCSFGGYEVARALNDNFIKNHSQQSLAISVGILLGLLIGYIIGGIIGRYYADALGSMEGSLFRVSGADVFFGARACSSRSCRPSLSSSSSTRATSSPWYFSC